MLQTHVNNDIYNKYCLIHNMVPILIKLGIVCFLGMVSRNVALIRLRVVLELDVNPSV